MLESIRSFLEQTAFSQVTFGNLVMYFVAALLLYVAIKKDAEPLLLVPISFGIILANIPPNLTGILDEGGLIWHLKKGVSTGIFPPLIFLGIGALTDFSFMLSYPITIFLGGAAQIGIFTSFLLANAIGFDLKQAASIGIIGSADGPTAIYLTSKFAPELLSAIAISAYSYIALIPILQPPVSKLLTTKKERMIRMPPPRPVSRLERIAFPVVVTIVSAFIVPQALPLIGMLMLGNLFREAGNVKRLVEGASRFILDSVTIILMLCVGASARAEVFLRPQSLMIFALGAFAFVCSIAGGILFAKFMNLFLKQKINPLIGAAGVSAVPMSARVAQKLATEEDPTNFILMHAMSPNVAGVIGSAMAAGVFLALIK
ncbi:sodium ion-translocating decarboxylase subunit beta [Pseudothermotoga thermarum]|uniref:Sodium ion-translocating decarboxylase, beta subunit n=1 Tax=Pseudothermotoga thermarum DSM 5069 TaxID=688269 RepID=F7YW14_9THEM|nr:sodium ion-translocating decarboxylase subunit beta [Pseudothermotoga thermarum]AEH50501.1 sodium ion-translocating decarboxylase, beta subunit [Pseudothermotoga thermarum DSM 5069]